MDVNLYMFGPSMEDWIRGKGTNTNILTPYITGL